MQPLESILMSGCLFVDNSMLETLRECPRKFFHQYVLHRTKPQDALRRGTILHRLLECRYSKVLHNRVTPELEAEQVTLLEQLWNETTWNDPEDLRNSLSHLLELFIVRYNQIYTEESFQIATINGKPAVELPFVYEFGSFKLRGQTIRVFYCGKIDMVVKENNKLWIVDFKSTSNLGSTFFDDKNSSSQFVGYITGIQQTTGQTCTGVMIHAVRTSTPPMKPRGQTLDQWWRSSFERDSTHIYEWQLVEWQRQTTELLNWLFWLAERDTWTEFRTSCVGKFGACMFKPVCDTVPGLDKDELLASTNYTHNDFTPLRKVNP